MVAHAGDPALPGVEKISEYVYGEALIEEFRLDNGLQVIIWEDPQVPVVAYQSWFGVGSRHEKEGRTGIAHLFEHLMFKATTQHAEGEFDRLMESVGADTNAATWVDWTYFHQKLPKEQLSLAIELESDRMANLDLHAPALEAEREVVKNERLGRVDNDPDGTLNETLYAMAFDKHPYGCPTIGWMRDIEAITLEDCLAFYRDYYAPNNAIITVVGDVDTRETLKLMTAHYGHLSVQSVARPTLPVEPPQTAEKRRTITQEIAAEKLVLAYHVPEVTHPDHPALSVLVEILTDGESSLLHERLVSELELASDTWGWIASFADPGLMEFGVTLLPGQRAADAEVAFDAMLAELEEGGVSDRKLRKVKNCMEASTLRGLGDTSARARGLGECAVTELDWKRFFEEPKLLASVTEADVIRVLRTYLRSDNRTLIIALPDEEALKDAPQP